MTYVKQTWVNGVTGGTPLNASRLAHIEEGIYRSIREGTFFISVKDKDFQAVGDGVADDTQAIASGIAAAQSAGAPLYFPAGTYKLSSFPAITTGSIHVFGAGRRNTYIKPTTPGAFISMSTSGAHYIHDITFDGTNQVAGTVTALTFNSGTSLNVVMNCDFINYINFPVRLVGSLDNLFSNCRWSGNASHLLLTDSASYPSNQNIFRSCIFTEAYQVGGVAVDIQNSEGNAFIDCLAQGNDTKYTFRVVGQSGNFEALGRWNIFRNIWFEDNGNLQVDSRNIWISGRGAAEKISGTIIVDCKLLSSGQNLPSEQIYIENADSTFIRGNYANLTSPNYSIRHGSNVTNTHVTNDNYLAGINDAGSYGPAIALRRSGAGQTILTGGVFTKVTFNNTDIDSHGNVASSRFTPSVQGVYSLTTQLVLENAVDAESWVVAIYKNGSAIASIPRVASGTGTQTYDANVLSSANGSTDYFEVFISNGGVTARNVGADSTFTAFKID